MSPTAAPPALAPQLSLGLPSYAADDPGGWQSMLGVARMAERAGVDRVVCSDHVVFGEHLDEYGKAENGGQQGGKQPTGPDGHWLEPMTVLSVVAGMTSRIRLGTNILVAALRRPVVLAKTAATLDVLSGGRLDLGVGVGWQREEYLAAGLAFEGRGRTLDHTLEVLHVLWTQRRAAYDTPELRFEAIHQMPKPLQPGGVPVWVSGTINKNTMARLARFGSGWITWGPDAADVASSIPRMRAAVAEHGRDPHDIKVAGTLPLVRTPDGYDLDRTMDNVVAQVAAGVTDFRGNIALPADEDEAFDRLRSVVAAFRSAVGRPALEVLS
jgi:probable F420-dependent oxidoreductase